jgi:hypothetical protein
MVLISSSELAKPARRLLTFNADLIEAGRGVKDIADLTEQLITQRREPSPEEIRTSHRLWTYATILYGRCFVTSDGRKPLRVDDAKRCGDAEAHELIMVTRHAQSAHVTLKTRRTEIFASFISRDGLRLECQVQKLAVIETYISIPPLEMLRRCERHIEAVAATVNTELTVLQARIAKRLNEEHLAEVKQSLVTRTSWPTP